MLLELNKITLELVRGDTFTLPLRLNSGTLEYPEHYKLTDGEYLYIGIMRPNQPFEEAMIRCGVNSATQENSDGDKVLVIGHDITSSIDPGKYYISIKYVDSEGFVETLVDHKILFVTGSPVPCGG